MPTQKRPTKARPKTKKRRARGAAQHHHHPELIGLGLVAVGIFAACTLWFGLNGGPLARGLTDAVGWGAYLLPLVAIPLGALMVARSALVSVRPFHLGLSVAIVGLLLALGQ